MSVYATVLCKCGKKYRGEFTWDLPASCCPHCRAIATAVLDDVTVVREIGHDESEYSKYSKIVIAKEHMGEKL